MEALNVGSLWKLPLVLVCENNGFSEFSPTETVTSGSIARRADPFGIPGQVVDGNDLVAVWQAARSAVRRAREGHGPTLLECRTYRLRGHVEYEVTFLSKSYREDAEVERRKHDDPILRHRQRLGSLAGEVAAIERQVDADVAAAVAFASEGPWPDAASATRHMFS
jgi:pyruvate dehydrogenase E1 component alpha subunit